MSARKIYFVRHGEALGNVDNSIQRMDTPLTEKGQKQAQMLADRFASIPIDALVVSTMLRAQQTVSYIEKKKGMKAEVTPYFHEFLRPSSLHGVLRSSDAYKTFAALEEEHYDDPSWRYEDGENFFDILARCQQGIQMLEERSEKNIVVVSHGRFVRFVVSYLLHKKEITPRTELIVSNSMSMTNTGVTLFEYSQTHGWKLITWNDHAHFAE